MTTDSDFIQVILQNTDAGYILVDEDLSIQLWSPWIEKRAFIPVEESIGRNLLEVFPQLVDSLLEQTIDQCRASQVADVHPKSIDPHPLPLYNDSADRLNDARLFHEISIKPVISDDGMSILLQVIDVTEAFLREMQLHEQTDIMEQLMTDISTREGQLRTLLDSTLDGIITLDEMGAIKQFNNAAEDMFGYNANEIIGTSVFTLIPCNGNDEKEQSFLEVFSDSLGTASEVLAVRKDRSKFMLEIAINEMDLNGDRHFVGSMRDITERTQAEKMIRHMAQHDALTDLPNRILFRERLESAMAYANRNNEMVAVMFLDLDRFKTINDSLGHHAGDALLCGVSDRLQSCIRSTDTVARLGGDEFAIIQTGIRKADGVKIMANKIIESIAQPFDHEGSEINTSTSIGITVHPTDEGDSDQLIQNADMAMYRAKRLGRNNFQFYSDDMHEEIQRTVMMEHEIRRAIQEQEFILYFQPQIDLHDSTIVGAEALIRWQHPERGMIPPGDFIPVAEDSGLIVPLGKWVLEESCRWAKSWHDRGVEMRIAVNLSASQFNDSDIVDTVDHILETSGLGSEFLELEITESLLMNNVQSTMNTLYRFEQMGVTISIDDFGTGYSSLAYLKRFPVSKIKIDRSFVKDVGTSKDDAVICQTVIGLGHSLGMTVVAEGVEDEEQLGFLQFHGCDVVQGYLTGRPMSEEAFVEFITEPVQIDRPILSIHDVRQGRAAN